MRQSTRTLSPSNRDPTILHLPTNRLRTSREQATSHRLAPALNSTPPGPKALRTIITHNSQPELLTEFEAQPRVLYPCCVNLVTFASLCLHNEIPRVLCDGRNFGFGYGWMENERR
jgi:hypothetical protein